MQTEAAHDTAVAQPPPSIPLEDNVEIEGYRELVADPGTKVERGVSALRDPETGELFVFRGMVVPGKGLDPDA